MTGAASTIVRLRPPPVLYRGCTDARPKAVPTDLVHLAGVRSPESLTVTINRNCQRNPGDAHQLVRASLCGRLGAQLNKKIFTGGAKNPRIKSALWPCPRTSAVVHRRRSQRVLDLAAQPWTQAYWDHN